MNNNEAIEKQPKDQAFSPFRIPKSSALNSLIEDVIGQLLKYEDVFGTRTRKRKGEDDKSFRKIVSAIVCDLTHNWLTSPERPIYITLSNRILGIKSRYTSPILSKTLPDVIKLLTVPEMNFIVMNKGSRGFTSATNKRTTITCGARLISRIADHKITLDDLAEDCTQETIILKGSKEDFFDIGERIDYQDTVLTVNYRSELFQINTWIAEANIQCNEEFDSSNRLLKRFFSNDSFESNGRYFGGFWQTMSKAQRKQSLYINDESIITLDYSQVAPKIAYGLCGVTTFNGDAYTLPSGKYNRKDIKKIFSAMIYADKPLNRFPKGTKEAFERRVKFAEVRDEILDYHKPISQLFGIGIGLKLMFIESQILMTALLECRNQDIVSLPVHDALIVAESNQAKAKAIMLSSFLKVTNTEGNVEVE